MIAKNRKSNGPRSSTFRPSRIYVFTVVAMAVLLANLAWRHPRGGDSVVEARMTYSRYDNATNQPVTDKEEITRVVSEMHSTQAIAELLKDLPAELMRESGIPPETAVEEISQRTFIRIAPDKDRVNNDLIVRFIGDSSAFGLKLIAQMTARYAAQHNNASDAQLATKQLADASVTVERIANQITDLEAQLNDFVTTELEAARNAHELLKQSQPTLTSPEVVDEPAESLVMGPPPATDPRGGPAAITMPVVEELNPDWVTLRDEIADVEQELGSLRVRFTNEHPDVRRLASTARDLQARLDETPQFLRQGSEGPSAPASVVSSNATTPSPTLPIVDDPGAQPVAQVIENRSFESEPAAQAEESHLALAEFDEEAERARIVGSTMGARLVEQLDQSRTDHRRAVASLAPLKEKVPEFRESTLLVGQPKFLRQYTEELKPSMMWSFIGFALAAGFGAALFRGRPVLPEALFSKSDAEKTMQMQSLGTITTNDGPEVELPSAGAIPVMARYAIRTSELVLLASAAAILFAACSIPEFSNHFLENPFAAFAMAVDRVSSFVS